MAGEAKVVDLRGELGAVEAPALVLAGEDDAWAPLESAREAADLLAGTTRFRSFPRARHSVFRDAPEAYDELRLFLDDLQAEAVDE
jgi:pimeloyl-ACP methyl ester carboxylesterase